MTEPYWLPAQLQNVGYVWITEDSVSMVYEAITSGAVCGILDMPRKVNSRVTKGIDALIKDGFITPFNIWQEKSELEKNSKQLNEAARCEDWSLKNRLMSS